MVVDATLVLVSAGTVTLPPRRTADWRAGRAPEQVTDERAAEPDKPG
jgi:hypothetical protein